MPTIVLRLDPRKLANPDTDLRYAVPEAIAARCGGIVTDDGYDYEDNGALMLFFLATDEQQGLACILDVIQNVSLLGNDLRPAAVVAVETPHGRKVVFPPTHDKASLS